MKLEPINPAPPVMMIVIIALYLSSHAEWNAAIRCPLTAFRFLITVFLKLCEQLTGFCYAAPSHSIALQVLTGFIFHCLPFCLYGVEYSHPLSAYHFSILLTVFLKLCEQLTDFGYAAPSHSIALQVLTGFIFLCLPFLSYDVKYSYSLSAFRFYLPFSQII
jgi:hypothetical protein